MSTYKMKKRQMVLIYLLFGTIAGFSFVSYFSYKSNLLIVSGVGSLVALYFFVLLSKITISTTDKVLKKSDFTGVKECNWDMIYSVNTYRMGSTGNYSTVLKWAQEPQYRNRIIGIKGILEKNPKYGVFDISDHFDGYVDLLKEVKEKAINAEIDKTTITIITGGK